MSLLEFILLSGASMFIIMDPISLVPLFLGMTPHASPQQRMRMARLACLVAACVLVLFALTGEFLFMLLGITLPAFKIAGSLVLLIVAMDMLQARGSAVKQTVEEAGAAALKEDIAITPLAVPLLAGPGAITTAILLQTQASGWSQSAALILCILAICLVSYLILRLASFGVTWISPIALKIATRIMGLLLAAVAIQFILDAIAEFRTNQL